MRLGLVGLGDAGSHHGRALARLEAAGALEWSAVCARGEAGIAQFRAANELPETVTGFVGLDALLASGRCDAVILATPDGLHVEQVIACAAAGVHVLVEKPLALDRPGARAAVDACAEAGVILAVGYHLRHHAGHRTVRDRLAELIGEVRRVDVRWAWADPAVDGWRATGAGPWSLAALGTHGIDLAMWLAGSSDIRSAAAVLDVRGGIDRAHELSLMLGPGVLAHVGGSIEYRAISRLAIAGELGEIECLGTLGARGTGSIVWRPPRGETAPIDFTPENPYAAQLEDFVAAIAERRRVDQRAALANVALVEDTIKSHARSDP